jgi:hypothetical protein
MHTKFLTEINAHNAMKESVDQWDKLLIGIMVWKLDDKILDVTNESSQEKIVCVRI